MKFEMRTSLWTTTLESFSADLAGLKLTPAAGTAAAVSANLAVSFLIKLLEITKARKCEEDDKPINHLVDAARAESRRLVQAAEEDGPAFEAYLNVTRKKADQEVLHEAMLRAIEVPMTGARSSVRALELSLEATAFVPAFIAADLAAVALLLSGAVRALLMTVDYNLSRLTQDDKSVVAERRFLEERAGILTQTLVDQMRFERPS
jgi:formiminotetrahydrofolate cyclodeaminase